MFKEYPDVVGIKESCAMLHIGKSKAYELLADGKIRSIRIKREYRIAKEAVIDFVRGR